MVDFYPKKQRNYYGVFDANPKWAAGAHPEGRFFTEQRKRGAEEQHNGG
jgi:hypothetical protein